MLGESLAANYLLNHGYRILDRNWRWRKGEIDLIVEKDGEIIFVEVKARRTHSYGTPQEAVTRAKQKKLIQSAYAYLESSNHAQSPWRIDVVALDLHSDGQVDRLDHIENAVRGH
ncbi:MAG: YraN family protein [Chloroflexi bacterium]|nr:YraN family protein [Chloroflexota bacterium]